MGRRDQRLRRERLDSRVPHVRYDWKVKSREIDDKRQLESDHTVRFTFVVLAKEPTKPADDFLAQIRAYDGGLELVTDTAPQPIGVKGFKYILREVEANVRPDEINWTQPRLALRRDRNLSKYSGKDLEAYISRAYSQEV